MAETDGAPEMKQEKLASDVREMNLKEEEGDVDMDSIPVAQSVKEESLAPTSGPDSRLGTGTPSSIKRQSRSPVKNESMAQSPAVKSDEEETIGGDIELKVEDGRPKLSRKKSTKVEKRPPQLFFDYEDKTTEATSTFSILTECNYANKYLGTTEHALECDCAEEWGESPLRYVFIRCPKYLRPSNFLQRLSYSYQSCLR